MRQSKFDGCVFHAYSHANHELIGVVALHVDDLCLGGNQEFEERIVAPLKKKYPFKRWHEDKGAFLGHWLEQQDNFDIHVHQKEYAKKLNGIQLDAARKKQDDMKTTDQEKKEMRAVLGAVNWLVSGSRPDLAASCSLLQQEVIQSVVADLIDVNRLVAAAHEGAETTIKIKSIKANDICFLAVSDAAWANVPSLCSQAGYMVAAIHKKIMSNCWSDFSLLRWKSYKQDRRIPSTLGAELIALSRAIAETRWIRSMWHEAVNYDYRLPEDKSWDQAIPIVAIVDNKPLYDHAKSEVNNSIKDKRHAIEMLIVKNDLRAHNIQLRWVATYQMVGDILTKKGVPVDLLRKVLQWGKFVIVEDISILPRNRQSVRNNFRGV